MPTQSDTGASGSSTTARNVTVCTPDHLHREMALAAIDLGLHVLAEKPLDTTVDGCQTIINAVNSKGVLLQVDFHKRFDPEHRAVERAIRQGRMGDVLYGYAWMEDRIEVPVDWFPSPYKCNATDHCWVPGASSMSAYSTNFAVRCRVSANRPR